MRDHLWRRTAWVGVALQPRIEPRLFPKFDVVFLEVRRRIGVRIRLIRHRDAEKRTQWRPAGAQFIDKQPVRRDC